jgi:hypothetical protein
MTRVMVRYEVKPDRATRIDEVGAFRLGGE